MIVAEELSNNKKEATMKRVKEFVHHPVSGASIFGEVLGPGDEMKEGDMYSSSSGKWEPCPSPGLTIPSGGEVIWVRHEKFKGCSISGG